MNKAKVLEARKTFEGLVRYTGSTSQWEKIFQTILAAFDDESRETARLRAENERLREAIRRMECSCLPHADKYPENKCDRCRALDND